MEPRTTRATTSSPLGMVLAYAVFATAWVLFADRFLAQATLLKDGVLVAVSLALFFYLATRRARALPPGPASRSALADREENSTVQQLNREQGFLKTLIHTIPDLVWLKDPHGVYLACNRTFERFFGAAEAAIVGKTDHDFVPRELADFFRTKDLEAIAAGGPRINEEWVTFADDGRRTLLETVKTPMFDKNGGLIGVLGIARDITASHEGEQALRDSEARFRKLVQLAPLPLCYVDRKGTILYLNERFTRQFGYTAEDLPNLEAWWPRAYPDPDYRRWVRETWDAALVQAAATGIDIEPIEYRVACKDGSTRLVEISGITIEEHFLATFNDLTDRRRAEEQRERADRLESLGVLAGGIAHDFNNILTAIVGNLSLARIHTGPDHPATARLADSEKALLRASELTRQLLTFARGGEPDRTLIDTGKLLREVASFSLPGSHSKVAYDLAPELWTLDADAGQVHQLLSNLLINADQAMPGGGTIQLRAQNRSFASPPGEGLTAGRYVEIEVSDQGVGIPAEILPKVFDPYFTTKANGSGIGLASAFSIVKRHGGAIQVASEESRGTTFSILLPAGHGQHEQPSPENVQQMAPAGDTPILAMDDEEMIRFLLQDMLTELGYAPMVCSDGQEAVELYREFRERGRSFAAVILDMTVPGGMGGREAAERILALDPSARLVISSGYTIDGIDVTPGQSLFRGAVKKPYNMQMLAEELARLLAAT